MSKYPKVAILSPITHNVPPAQYGPWERVVYNLQAGLVELGVDVTVFATKAAQIEAKREYLFDSPTGELTSKDKTSPALMHTVNFLKSASKFDVLHLHLNVQPVLLSELVPTPSLTTLHGCGVEKDNDLLFDAIKDHNFISISNFERNFRPQLNYLDTVFNGVDPSLYTFKPTPGNYLLFSGRVVHDKGIYNAITLSKLTGIPLKIAGPITDQHFFDTIVKPELDDTREYIGNLSQSELSETISNALACIFLIEWDEPFGLSIVDSLISGVPAIANAKGAQPELINSPELGIIVNSVEEAAAQLDQIRKIDRAACRDLAIKTFSRDTMAKKYLENYMHIM